MKAGMTRSSTTLGLPGTITPRGLQLPVDLTFEAWEAVGQTLQTIAGSVLWWLGDWWRYGEVRFGEEAAQAVSDLGYAIRSVQVAAWVCDRFPPIRRLISVPFNVHQALAGVDDEAARFVLLEEAAKGSWTVREARERVREQKQLAGTVSRELEVNVAGRPDAPPTDVDGGRSVDVGEVVLTLYGDSGLLRVERRDNDHLAILLHRVAFSDDAKALVRDFLDGDEMVEHGWEAVER